jgi:hypothetical protein
VPAALAGGRWVFIHSGRRARFVEDALQSSANFMLKAMATADMRTRYTNHAAET